MTMKNYHNLGGLKQQTLILSRFWRLEIQDQGISRTRLFLKILGTTHSLPILASGGSRDSLTHGHIIPISASMTSSSSSCMSLLCLSFIRTLVIGFRAHLNNPVWSLPLKILGLSTFAKTLFLKKVTLDINLGGHNSSQKRRSMSVTYLGHCLYYHSQNWVDTDINKSLNSKKSFRNCIKLYTFGDEWSGGTYWKGRGRIRSWAFGLVKPLHALRPERWWVFTT